MQTKLILKFQFLVSKIDSFSIQILISFLIPVVLRVKTLLLLHVLSENKVIAVLIKTLLN